MATVSQLIQDALQLIGEFGVGEGLSPEDGANGLVRLNSMLDSWSIRRLFIFNINIAAYALVANDGDYTIGAGGDFDATRPNRIDSATILMLVDGAYVKVKDLDILTQGEYVELSDTNATAKIPEKLYMDSAYPLATIFLYPKPTVGVGTKLQLSTWDPLTTFAAITDTFSMPPGYYLAVVANLAVELGPSYNKQPDQALAAKALEGIAAIQSLNRINGMADLNTQPTAGPQPSAAVAGQA